MLALRTYRLFILKWFISHSSDDTPFLMERLLPLLATLQVEAWHASESIKTGSEWEPEFKRGLESCTHFVALISRSALGSKWVKKEIVWAMQNRKGRIIPVVLFQDRALETTLKRLHRGLGAVQYVDLANDDRLQWIKLIDAVVREMGAAEKDGSSTLEQPNGQSLTRHLRGEAIRVAELYSGSFFAIRRWRMTNSEDVATDRLWKKRWHHYHVTTMPDGRGNWRHYELDFSKCEQRSHVVCAYEDTSPDGETLSYRVEALFIDNHVLLIHSSLSREGKRVAPDWAVEVFPLMAEEPLRGPFIGVATRTAWNRSCLLGKCILSDERLVGSGPGSITEASEVAKLDQTWEVSHALTNMLKNPVLR